MFTSKCNRGHERPSKCPWRERQRDRKKVQLKSRKKRVDYIEVKGRLCLSLVRTDADFKAHIRLCRETKLWSDDRGDIKKNKLNTLVCSSQNRLLTEDPQVLFFFLHFQFSPKSSHSCLPVISRWRS